MSSSDPAFFHGLIKDVTAEYDRIQLQSSALATENAQLRIQLVKTCEGIERQESTVSPKTPLKKALQQQFWHGAPRQLTPFYQPSTPRGCRGDEHDVNMGNHHEDEIQDGPDSRNVAFSTLQAGVNSGADMPLKHGPGGEVNEDPHPKGIDSESRPDEHDCPDGMSSPQSYRKDLSFRAKGAFEEHFALFHVPLSNRPTSSMDGLSAFKPVTTASSGFSDVEERTMCMIHPASRLRTFWGFASFILLLYDLVFVPVDLCFDVPDKDFAIVAQLTTRLFWSLDIPMSFATGIYIRGKLVMHFAPVANHYLRSWFPFDIFLATVEWLTFWIIDHGGSSPVSVFRVVRGSRLVRLLRVIRFVKFQKVKPFLRGILVVSSQGMDSFVDAMKYTFIAVAILHVFACIWHVFGTLEKGWVSSSGLEHSNVSRKYAVSLHWVLMRDDANVIMNSTGEYFVSVALQLIAVGFLAFYFGLWTNLVITWAHSDAAQMSIVARHFIQDHGISYHLGGRIYQCLSTLRFHGVSEVLANEKKLKEHFPALLQKDVNYEVRWWYVQAFPLLADIHSYHPRCIRSLCHEAMAEMLGVQSEKIFSYGDLCNEMYIICAGVFSYKLYWNASGSCSMTPAESSGTLLGQGHLIAEAVLWTHWEHLGKCVATEESILIRINAEEFSKVVMGYSRPKVHAVKYARHFCWRLNRSEPSDLISFELPVKVLDEVLHIGGVEDHFAFISHFKVEAGTEATLMREELEAMVRKDHSNPAGQFVDPIFVDSENLVDLRRLVNHVEGSFALVLLLSPGLLTRPWCLLEIVTAKRRGRPFVPVLLNRPGLSYQFPNDEFYRKLHRDEIIDGGVAGRKLLKENDVELDEVEAAIRAVFLMIALPYSPHKSGAVRKAELHDIFKRCMLVTQEAMRKYCSDVHARHGSELGDDTGNDGVEGD